MAATSLTTNVWLTILEFLSYPALFACYRSSKFFFSMFNANDEAIFKKRILRKWPDKNYCTSYFLSKMGASFDKMAPIFQHVNKYYTFEVRFKILVQGPPQAGKSAFLAAFMEGKADKKPVPTAAGMDFVRNGILCYNIAFQNGIQKAVYLHLSNGILSNLQTYF